MEDLPPGFRFYPTEEELISFYLHNKLEGRREDLNRIMDRIIPVLDIYEHNPWELPQFAGDLSSRDPEQWFFFIPRQESEARGGRPKRLTTNGYWKATGSPGQVFSNNSRIIGIKRTMVFYTGRAPYGRKTVWKMNEYKAIVQEHASSSSSTTAGSPVLRHEFSLCRVYKKSKSLRAFDRRPLGVEMLRDQTGAAAHGDEATTSCQNLKMEKMEIANSPDESSSSQGTNNNIPDQIGERSNIMPMVTDTQPFWDWDPLDWNYLEETIN
ncbi:NAC domain-containing protein 90-like [Jatropha curcas]|nr:NAC domain-containing protein 90-like [Jatropha curcas]